MRHFHGIWHRLTESSSSDEEIARNDSLSKTILSTMGISCLLFMILVVILWGTGLFTLSHVIIILATTLLTWAGWWMADRGYWYVSRYLPPTIFFAMGLYLTFQDGVVTTGVVYFAITILLAVLLLPRNAQWVLVGLCLVSYIGVGVLAGERDLELLASTAISTTVVLLIIASLQRLSTDTLEKAYGQVRAHAEELREHREHLEELVEARTGALKQTHEELQREVTQRRRAEENLLAANEDLEALVQDRTATLMSTNVQLEQEIHVRAEVEEALQDSSAKLRAIFETIADGVIVTDSNGYIVEANASAVSYYGSTRREDVIGLYAFDLVAEEDREAAAARFFEVLERGPGRSVEYTVLGKDRDEIICELSAAVLNDRSGNPVGLVIVLRDITERKRIDAELHHNEERFRSIVQHLLDMVWIIDADTRFSYITPSTTKILGYEPADLIGKIGMDFVHPDDVKQMLHDKEEVIRFENDFIPTPFRFRHADGHWVQLEAIGHNLLDEPAVNGIVVTVRDISERSMTTERLAQSENRYRSIVQVAPDGILTVSLTGTVLSCNSRFLELSGFTEDQIVGKHLTKLPTLRKRDLPRWMSVFTSFVRGAPTEPIAFEWIHASGTVRWGEARISLLRSGGRIEGLLVLVRDITEDRRSQDMLQALNGAALAMERALTHEEVFQAVSLELKKVNIAASIYLTDESREHLTTNYLGFGAGLIKAAEKLVGLRQSDFRFSITDVLIYRRVVKGRETVFVTDVEEIARGVLPPPLNRMANELISLLKAPRIILAPLISDDEVFGVFVVQSEYLIEDDAPAITAFAHQVAATWHKTSLIHTLEESLADLNRTQDQLLQAQRMEAVGRLAGGVAHDFNNLLTAISGYTDLTLSSLSGGYAGGDVERQTIIADLNEVSRASERARSLTQQLLAFSRKQVLEPRVLNLNSLVEDIEKMLHRLIGEDIRFRTIFSPSLWRVRADPGQLEQVILNLALNARDAMPSGGRLTIETHNVVADEELMALNADCRPGEYVMLSVSDTGIGIDDETLPHIFEPFFTTKREGRGTGLGLATVYGVVAQSEGFITAESEIGQGTTFRVYLPRTEMSGESLTVASQSAELPGGSETILLAEDEKVVRDLVSKVLVGCGYSVLVADHPHRALEFSSQHDGPIHLLLSDVVMPDMTGPQLAEQLTPTRTEMQVLFMSGYADGKLDQMGHLEAAGEFLQKPFAPQVLAQRIRQILD